jgi:hypothetical protein
VQLTIEKIRANPEVVKPGGQMEVLVSVHAKNVVMPIPQRYARLVVWRNSEQHDLTVKAVSAKGGMTASLGGFSTVASTKQVICRFKAPEEPGSYTYDVSVYYETKDGLSPAVWDTITFKVSDESAPTPKQTPARQAPSSEWEHLSVAENIVGDWIYSPSSLKHAGINLKDPNRTICHYGSDGYSFPTGAILSM